MLNQISDMFSIRLLWRKSEKPEARQAYGRLCGKVAYLFNYVVFANETVFRPVDGSVGVIA